MNVNVCYVCCLVEVICYACDDVWPWTIMACLYEICECEQYELYDMKHDKLFGTITPIEMCMKCEMKMRMTWSLERDRRLLSLKINVEIGGPHALCVFMHLGDTLIPSRGYGRVHPMAGQRSLCIAWRCRDGSSFNGSRHKGLPEYAHRIRTVAQRCAN